LLGDATGAARRVVHLHANRVVLARGWIWVTFGVNLLVVL
jgi:hypothetical protein